MSKKNPLVGLEDETEEAALPTHELMAYLSEAERDRFVKLQETFETAGWQLIVDYAGAKVTEHAVNGANAASWEENRRHLGARLAWDRVANLATEFMNAFESVALAARDAQTEEVEDDI